jgi:hypothetical protein
MRNTGKTLTPTKLNVIENTAAMLEIDLNSLILGVSFATNTTGREAINIVIECLEKKLEIGKPIICGGIELNEVNSTLHPRLTGEVVKKILIKYAKKQKSAEPSDSGYDLEASKSGFGSISGNRHATSEPVSGVFLSKRQSSTQKNPFKSLTENEDMMANDDELIVFKTFFAGCTRSEFEVLIQLAKSGPIEITNFESKKLVKCFSVSAGIHERLHGSSVRNIGEATLPRVLASTIRRIIGDVSPPTSPPIPFDVLPKANSIIQTLRSGELTAALKRAGVNKKGLEVGYVLEGRKLYFGNKVNGRPDAVLKNSKGQIVGVIEFKGVGRVELAESTSTAFKQLSLYHLLFGAVESYLVFHRTGTAKFNPIVYRLPEEEIENAPQLRDTLQANLDRIREAAFSYNGRPN